MIVRAKVCKRWMSVALVSAGILLTACSSGEQPTSTPVATVMVVADTATAIPPTLAPTDTPLPTDTPVPTATPAPTETAAPVNAPTTAPQQATSVTFTDAQATDL